MKKLLLSLNICVAPCLALANTSVTGHVVDVSIQKDFGSYVFIQLDAPQTSPITCQTNLGWTYTLPQQTDADKKILAMLLVAKASGQSVRLRGAGACNEFGAVESAIGIDILQ